MNSGDAAANGTEVPRQSWLVFDPLREPRTVKKGTANWHIWLGIGDAFNGSVGLIAHRDPFLFQLNRRQLLEASGGGKAPFEISNVSRTGNNLVITWPSSPSESFASETGTNLQDDWEEKEDGYPADGGGDFTTFEFELDPVSDELCIRVPDRLDHA